MLQRSHLLASAILIASAFAVGCGSTDTQDDSLQVATGGAAEGAADGAAIPEVADDSPGDPVGLHRFHRWCSIRVTCPQNLYHAL